MNTLEGCKACDVNKHPSWGTPLKEYKHWILQHYGHPAPVVGWLVLRAKRHAVGLEGMNAEEAHELGHILDHMPKVLKDVCEAERIYVCCFSEAVPHVHYAVIPRREGDEFVGAKMFDLERQVKEDPQKAASKHDVLEIIEKLKAKL